jgi:hypothetical protein
MAAKTYYEVLGLRESASDSEIKRAYRRLAIQLHPDRNAFDKSGEAFKILSNAYEVLGDAGMRAEYDASLARKKNKRTTRDGPPSARWTRPGKARWAERPFERPPASGDRDRDRDRGRDRSFSSDASWWQQHAPTFGATPPEAAGRRARTAFSDEAVAAAERLLRDEGPGLATSLRALRVRDQRLAEQALAYIAHLREGVRGACMRGDGVEISRIAKDLKVTAAAATADQEPCQRIAAKLRRFRSVLPPSDGLWGVLADSTVWTHPNLRLLRAAEARRRMGSPSSSSGAWEIPSQRCETLAEWGRGEPLPEGVPSRYRIWRAKGEEGRWLGFAESIVPEQGQRLRAQSVAARMANELVASRRCPNFSLTVAECASGATGFAAGAKKRSALYERPDGQGTGTIAAAAIAWDFVPAVCLIVQTLMALAAAATVGLVHGRLTPGSVRRCVADDVWLEYRAFGGAISVPARHGIALIAFAPADLASVPGEAPPHETAFDYDVPRAALDVVCFVGGLVELARRSASGSESMRPQLADAVFAAGVALEAALADGRTVQRLQRDHASAVGLVRIVLAESGLLRLLAQAGEVPAGATVLRFSPMAV